MQLTDQLVWHRARGYDTGQCVEVANQDGKVLVRDSEDPDTILTFGTRTWATFLDGILSAGFIQVAANDPTHRESR